MDLGKLLLVAAAIVGLVLLIQIAAGPGELPDPPEGRFLDGGTFALVQGGNRLGEEKFSAWIVAQGFRIDTEVKLAGGEVRQGWMTTASSWSLTRYENLRSGPRVWETTSVKIEQGQVTVETKAGLSRKTKKLPEVPPLLVQDPPAVGPWFAALRMILGGTRRLALLKVRDGQIVPVEVRSMLAVGLQILGKKLPVERYTLRVGEEEVILYGQGDLLIGLSFPGQGLQAYMVEVLPTGLVESEL